MSSETGVIVASVIGGLGLFALFYSGSPSTVPSATTTVEAPAAVETPPAPPPPPVVDCKTDWRLCEDNSALANSNSSDYFHARFACKESADGMAKYGTPDWGNGWFQFPFTGYHPGDSAAKTGKMILFEDNAKFQNGFGAMAHVRVSCVYNFNTKSVEDVNILEQ
jgi:hypothetical protein